MDLGDNQQRQGSSAQPFFTSESGPDANINNLTSESDLNSANFDQHQGGHSPEIADSDTSNTTPQRHLDYDKLRTAIAEGNPSPEAETDRTDPFAQPEQQVQLGQLEPLEPQPARSANEESQYPDVKTTKNGFTGNDKIEAAINAYNSDKLTPNQFYAEVRDGLTRANLENSFGRKVGK